MRRIQLDLSTNSFRKVALDVATAADHRAIYQLRHEVYADELGQYETRQDGVLADAPDLHGVYLTASVGEKIIGFVGITPPGSPQYSVDRYLDRAEVPVVFDDRLYEIRALTVRGSFRGSQTAMALMYAALRWVEAHGGQRIIAVGRREVIGMYQRIGLKEVGRSFRCGAVTYDVMTASTDEIAAWGDRHQARMKRMEERIDWRLPVALHRPSRCFHGGGFFDAIGDEFDDPRRSEWVISADVLDAWFPPAPAARQILHEHLDWMMRTSPPTHAEGLVRTIARVRGVEPDNILTGGGSSPLMFLAFRHWLTPSSRVLILDPMYGEYAHLLENVIRCQVERFPLERSEGYRVQPQRLAARLRRGGFDLFVWVNPNSPTGLHVPRAEVEEVLRESSATTRVWIDETYVDYAGPDCSLERFAAASANTLVCKSLSKVYALSGLRVGYLCGSPHQLEELRSLTPPWSVSLAAQMAAIAALKSPEYYAERYQETHVLRSALVEALHRLGIRETVPGIANFVLFYLPDHGPDTATVLNRCREQGLYLRDVKAMGSSMGEGAVRLAVKDAATNQRLIDILRDALKPGASERQTQASICIPQ